MVSKMIQIKKTALVVTMDFTAFFQACNEYAQSSHKFELIDHQYFLYNLVCYTDNAQLSVRRAVSSGCKYFLSVAEGNIHPQGMVGQGIAENTVLLCLKIYRVFLQMLSKQNIQHNEAIYWNIVDNIDLFFTWISKNSSTITQLFPKSNVHLYPSLMAYNDQDKSYFKLFGSLSESSKLKGLKLLRTTLQNMAK